MEVQQIYQSAKGQSRQTGIIKICKAAKGTPGIGKESALYCRLLFSFVGLYEKSTEPDGLGSGCELPGEMWIRSVGMLLKVKS